MDWLHDRIQCRNDRETTPFRPVYESYTQLVRSTHTLQAQLRLSEQEVLTLRQQIQEPSSSSNGSSALQSALRNETRLRDKLEQLQEEYNEKLKKESDIQAEALKTASLLREAQDQANVLEEEIQKRQAGEEAAKIVLSKTQEQLEESQQHGKLIETQADALKTTIRDLQDDNDKLVHENRTLEERLVSEKMKMVTEMTHLTDLVERLKAENDMLRNLGKKNGQKEIQEDLKALKGSVSHGRKFGDFGIVAPTAPQHTVSAHTLEGTCLRYDSTSDLLVTSSYESSIKVWDASRRGSLRAVLHGTQGHAFASCDIRGNHIVAGGSDKTCRVWSLKTQRMIHQLVGHQHKILGVRMIGRDKALVLSGSADRTLKLWDISRRTYRQTTTFPFSAALSCFDASDTIAVSGHVDGGLRCWDLAAGKRSSDIAGLHTDGRIVSVDLHTTPRAVTTGVDSTAKLVDLRTHETVRRFRDPQFVVSGTGGWARSVLSPDGQFVLASSETGKLIVWNVGDGKCVNTLDVGESVVGLDWRGHGAQQVATLDRKGVLVLWA